MSIENLSEFPDKLFYKINEVSKYTGIEDYVLRYWESEFPQLAPQKNKHNTRLYKKSDIDLILKIKRLLKEEKFTISGAKDFLKKEALQSQKTVSNLKGKSGIINNKKSIRSLKKNVSLLKTEIADIIRAL